MQKYAVLGLRENSSGKYKGITRIRDDRKLRILLFRVSVLLIGKDKEFSKIYMSYLVRKDNTLKKK